MDIQCKTNQQMRFMPLGGKFDGNSSRFPGGVNFFNHSTIIKKDKKEPIKHLPDIFVTCPELRKFELPNFMPAIAKINNNSEDKNKDKQVLTNPEILSQQTPSQSITIPVSTPPMNSNEIQMLQPPIIYTKVPIYNPIQIFQVFDPNAPIIRPYVFFL